MGKDHLKTLAAPRTWPIERKQNKYVTRPKPGRPFKLAVPLGFALKRLVKKGDTTKQARYLLHHHEVLINGSRERSHRRPVGFLDVISFPSIDEHYILSLSKQGVLTAVEIDKKQAESRLVKINGKTRTAGKFQINCNDGSNILVDKNNYSTGDTLVLSKGKISKHLPLKVGAQIMLTGGSHQAMSGVVESIEDSVIAFKHEDQTLTTHKRHAFVVGDKQAEVSLR